MPDLIGSAPSDAEQFARANGLALTQDEEYSTRVAPGFIAGQDPAPGSVVAPGATIRIVVSLGDAPPATPRPPTFTPTVVVATAAPTATETAPPQATRDDDDDDPPTRPPATAEPTKEPPPTDKPPPPSTQTAPDAHTAVRHTRLVRGLARPDHLLDSGALVRRPMAAPLQTASATHTTTATPDATTTMELTQTASPTTDASLTPTSSVTPDLTLTAWASVSPTGTITNTPTITPTDTSTPTATNTPTDTPTPTSTPTATPTPTFTPAPRYLPLVTRANWLLCAPPWTGIDDPEPNDARLNPVFMTRLCLDTPYTGRLFRSTTADTSDFFVVAPRRGGSFEVRLEVPPDLDVDYDVYLYLRDGAELGPRGVNDPGVDEVVIVEGMPSRAYYVRVVNADFREPIEKPYTLSWRYR
jgi:hypothetical protein